MPTAIISTKGWVVVPKEYRLKYGLEPGTKVQIIDYGGGLSIVPIIGNPVTALRGMFAGGPSLTADLIVERQHAKASEEAKAE